MPTYSVHHLEEDGQPSRLLPPFETDADPYQGCPVILQHCEPLSARERRKLLDDGMAVFHGQEFRIVPVDVKQVIVGRSIEGRIYRACYRILPLNSYPITLRGAPGDYEGQPFQARVIPTNPWQGNAYMISLLESVPWEAEEGRRQVTAMARAAIGDEHMKLTGADIHFARAALVFREAPVKHRATRKGRR